MKLRLSISLLLLLLVFLFLLSGCIDDDTSDCSSMISLRVKAEVSVSGETGDENTFNDTGVYVFDSQGVLIEYGRIQSEGDANGQLVEFSVPEGKYTIVTWCGADFDNDYEVVAVTSSGAFTGRFVKGETRLSDMRLRAKTGEVSDTRTGDLFWGTVQEVTVSSGVLPYETTVVGTDLHLRLRTLRLFIDIPVILTVTGIRTGNAVYTADLIELILKNPAYRTQADLDKEDTYKIVVGGTITAPDTGISITVKGWEIIILEPI